MVLGKLTLSRICNDKIYIFKGVFFLLFRSALKMTKTKKVIVSKLFRLLFPQENFKDKKKRKCLDCPSYCSSQKVLYCSVNRQ